MIDPGIFKYFRACYQTDNSRVDFSDIFHKNVEHRLFVEDRDEVHAGLLEATPLVATKAEAARDRAWIYRKEKGLIFGSLLLLGKPAAEDENSAFMCGPLMTYPAEISVEEGVGFAKPDLARGRLNRSLLERLPHVESEVTLDDRVAALMTSGPITPGTVATLANLLEKCVPNMEASQALHWPDLVNEAEVRKRVRSLKRRQRSSFCLLPVSFIALVPKSRGARGVLNELNELATEGAPYATPLRALFADLNKKVRPPKLRLARVPAVLSTSQEKILHSAAHQPLTLVTGPPGTGKSFTIAAAATEHLSRNQTVLIVSKMNHAVDVIAQKIEELTGITGCCIRGGSSNYLRTLKTNLRNLASGIGLPDQENMSEQKKNIWRQLLLLDAQIEKLEHRIGRTGNREMKWGRIFANEPTGLLTRFRLKMARWMAGRTKNLWTLIDEYDRLVNQRIKMNAALVKVVNQERRQNLFGNHRKTLQRFMGGLRARTGGRQEKFFQETNFRKILDAFPVWLVNLADLSSVLPLEKELFDLVIIDEATQCDIASCLPALQRAKRLLVFGDPHQLRHISFLARKRQQEYLKKFAVDPNLRNRFDYREKSFLDLMSESIDDQDQVIFLNEHFRSRPAIIDFSNRRFYAGALRVMTEKPGITHQPSLMMKQGKGKRLANGANKEEAKRLVASLMARIEADRHIPDHLAPSIGVVSPFRNQVTAISDMLLAQLDRSDLDRHRILVGTAHTFQGEERDLVYLSLSLDAAYHPSSLRFLEQPGVFNVTVTRARTYQEIHFSLQLADLPAQSLTRAYLEHVDQDKARAIALTNPPINGDQFLSEVRAALEQRGVQLLAEQSVAGFIMDLVALNGNRLLTIDLIGYPGSYEDFIPIDHYRIYARTGFDIFTLPYSKWVTARQQCLEALWKKLALP